MLNWIQSFGEVKRIGVGCTGTYGAGLLRYLQQFDIEILEVTSLDKADGASAAKTTQSIRRMQLMQHSRGYAP